MSRRGTAQPYTKYYSDEDARYSERFTIDLDQLEPIVALPSLPSNGRFIGEIERVKMDQVYIGSCTNGRIEDLRIAAQILKGHKVANGTRAIVVPATTEIWKTAMREGLLEIFSDAGCVVSTATCGACLGGFMGVPGSGGDLPLDDQPQLRRPDGQSEVEGLPGEPGDRRGDRHHRDDHRSPRVPRNNRSTTEKRRDAGTTRQTDGICPRLRA
jgi:hypothetical protein